MEALSKDQIRDKLVRLAAARWKIEENEIEANFDPLVILLFDAVAGEIENLGYRIKDIHNDLLHELSTVMLPQSLLRARPASCILRASPIDDFCIISDDFNFITSTKIITDDNHTSKDIQLNFTPIGENRLVNVKLNYVRAGDKIFKYSPEGKKIVINDAQSSKIISRIDFSFQSEKEIKSLEGLQFFFDLKSHSDAKAFYFCLQNATLIINDASVEVQNGYYNNQQYETTLKDAFANNSDYTRKIQREIANIYEKQFLTITNSSGIQKQPNNPAILENLPEKISAEIKATSKIYGSLILKYPFKQETLDRLQIAVNTFPAINRNLESSFYKTEKWLNIIPLQIQGSYLDIKNIEGVDGTKYKLSASENDDNLEEGEAIIRASRVSKNSSNDIRNALKSLLEAVRDESAYFSKTSNNTISGRLQEISKILTRLEDQVNMSKDKKPTFRYALLKSKNPGENIQVQYWTTSPTEAAFVKSFAVFSPVRNNLLQWDTCFAVTPALGGTELLNNYAQKQLLVRQLTSKGKIVSVEDVKLLCYELFGQKLKRVSVNKKMKILPEPAGGIARCILIQLYFSKDNFPTDEITYQENLLRYQLQLNGSFTYPIEIISVVE